jgi:hypothetical protein
VTGDFAKVDKPQKQTKKVKLESDNSNSDDEFYVPELNMQQSEMSLESNIVSRSTSKRRSSSIKGNLQNQKQTSPKRTRSPVK